jgi:hypothetical protein
MRIGSGNHPGPPVHVEGGRDDVGVVHASHAGIVVGFYCGATHEYSNRHEIWKQ